MKNEFIINDHFDLSPRLFYIKEKKIILLYIFIAENNHAILIISANIK